MGEPPMSSMNQQYSDRLRDMIDQYRDEAFAKDATIAALQREIEGLKANQCTPDEREHLDGLYKEHPELKGDLFANFDGWYCDWNEILDIFRDEKDNSYGNCPTELILRVINERDELKVRVTTAEREIEKLRALAEGRESNGPHSRTALMNSLQLARDHEAALIRRATTAERQIEEHREAVRVLGVEVRKSRGMKGPDKYWNAREHMEAIHAVDANPIASSAVRGEQQQAGTEKQS